VASPPRRALLESFKTHGELGGATTAASPPAIADEGSAGAT